MSIVATPSATLCLRNMTSTKGLCCLKIDRNQYLMTVDITMEALAARYGQGQHGGLECPVCGAKDRAFSLYVSGASIKGICHRASCGFRYNNNGAGASISSPIASTRAKPYTGALSKLDEADYLWLQRKFRLPMSMLQYVCKSDGRYMLSILAPDGSCRGLISRRPWETSPLFQMGDNSPKALTYMENEEPAQSWYWPRSVEYKTETVVIVEDQISAMRIAEDTGLAACAILGTGLNEEKVSEIQRHARNILIALDSDATGQAFSLARKWGQAFNSCRVIILQHDLKDCDVATIQKIFS